MSEIEQRLHDNLAGVLQRVGEAAAASGRSPNEVTLVGVSKYVDAEMTQALVDAGCSELGESRPQSLWKKGPVVEAPELRWHLIGHLQSNKVRRTLPLLHLLHSLDRLSIIKAVNEAAASLDISVRGLLQVNISGDEAKHGFRPDEMPTVLEQMVNFEKIEVKGLMSMAGLEGGRERARRDFAALRSLREELLPNCPDALSLEELSMGMSRDFDIAIEEGATLVRVGSTLFEGIDS